MDLENNTYLLSFVRVVEIQEVWLYDKVINLFKIVNYNKEGGINYEKNQIIKVELKVDKIDLIKVIVIISKIVEKVQKVEIYL